MTAELNLVKPHAQVRPRVTEHASSGGKWPRGRERGGRLEEGGGSGAGQGGGGRSAGV